MNIMEGGGGGGEREQGMQITGLIDRARCGQNGRGLERHIRVPMD